MFNLNRLRINLTLLNTGVLIGLLLFIVIFLYMILSLDVENNVNGDLQIYCSQLANEIEFLERERSGEPVAEEEKQGYLEYSRSLVQNNIAYIMYDHEFVVLDQSSQLPFTTAELQQIAGDYFSENREKYLFSNYKTDDRNYKICTYRIVNKNGELKTIQVMKNMALEREFLDNTVKIIGLITMLGASLSFLGGYFLSGRSLIPIKKTFERQQEFLADASHELRTPIAVIQTNLEVVKTSGEETVDSQKIWLDNAYGEVRRMQRIVEDLMFLARADSGDLQAPKTAVDLTFLLKVVTEKMVPLAAKKSISLYNNVAEDLLIEGDEKQITQVFVILLDNAIKYSNEASMIKINAQMVNNGIQVQVIDQGIGIPEADIKKVTQRFYRVDKARSRTEGGTGLGLSIAKWIVEEHQGELRIESQENVGTTVTVVFNKGETN
ncbi:MAG: two-component system, OmpR family, sensor histidine kinase CiaH [Eubacteriaceae bacterium]|nr:two-component system, OmpR family, sensor histidine kinase CiaH [Eubacteriaceae bacterium]